MQWQVQKALLAQHWYVTICDIVNADSKSFLALVCYNIAIGYSVNVDGKQD